MRFLRMITNAAMGGLLGGAYLTVLVLQLNPQVPELSISAFHWLMVLVGFYGVQLAIGLFVLMIVRDSFGARPLSPAWLSVRLLAWIGAMLASTAALLTWANLKGFRAVLDAASFERAQVGAAATTICAAVLFVLVIARYSFGRRGGRWTGVLLSVTLVASIAVPAVLRGPGDLGWTLPAVPRQAVLPLSGEPVPRVRIIAVDGASLGYIRERVAAGSLPNVGRLLDRGAVIDLATLKPTQPDPVWAAAATGKYPPKNGVRSAGVYRARPADPDVVDLLPDFCFAYSLPSLNLVREDNASEALLRARPFWDILADYHIAAGVVRWPLTFPAHATRGYVISDRFDAAGSSPLRSTDTLAGAPTSAVDIAREVFDEAQGQPVADLVAAAGLPRSVASRVAAARWDLIYERAADALDEQFVPAVSAIRLTGVDLVAHGFLQYAEPARFGNVSAAEVRQFGGVLDAAYSALDARIGRELNALDQNDLLLVVSGFGMEPQRIAKQVIAQILGRAVQMGTHEAAPDGFLLAYGTNVAAGQRPRGAIVDLAPTVLYYLGVPIGRDMDGFARADMFTKAFNADHFLTFVASHER